MTQTSWRRATSGRRAAWIAWLIPPLLAAPAFGQDEEAEPVGSGDASSPGAAQVEPDQDAAGSAGDQEFEEELLLEGDLLLFDDIPLVITSSRQERPANLSPAPISILDEEDLHYSGLTSLPEILQFAPGLDVIPFDRNNYAVGVHGLHGMFSDRTLTLLNGRSVNDPSFGGTDWLGLPVFIEDIERIEVVRGPGGAAWGANAYHGVVNIITKDPEDTLGLMTSVTADTFGDLYSQVRWGAEAGDWVWRVSGGYRYHDTSDDALTGENFDSDDWRRDWRFDATAARNITEQDRLSIGAAYSYYTEGGFEFLTDLPEGDGRHRQLRTFARLDHEFSSDASGYVQWYTNDRDNKYDTITRLESLENDLEAQGNFAVAENHEVSIGGNFRFTHINASPSDYEHLRIRGEPLDEWWAGLFAMDHFQVTDDLSLDLQLRGDRYSETEVDWSGRLTVQYIPDAANRNVLRVSAAKSFRAPTASFLRMEADRIPIAPGINLVELQGNRDLDHEEIYSLEAGISSRPLDWLTVRVDGYYQDYHDLIGLAGQQTGPRTVFTAENGRGADAFGVDTEVAAHSSWGRLSAWYSWIDFDLEDDPQRDDIRSYLPARNKVGSTARLYLPRGLTLNANYRYTDVTKIPRTIGPTRVSAYHRFDVTVSKQLFDGRAELLLGVADVFDDSDIEASLLGGATAHDVPGRTFFGRFQLQF